MTTPSIPGVERNSLADVIRRDLDVGPWTSARAADAALAHIAAHHECACDREHADEWVEVDEDTWYGLPSGARRRREWLVGVFNGGRFFVHRDDLPDPDADLVERMAKAIFALAIPNGRWEGWSKDVQEHYRDSARAALAVVREGER